MLEVLHVVFEHLHPILIIKLGNACLLLDAKPFTDVLDEVLHLRCVTSGDLYLDFSIILHQPSI